MKNLTEWKHGFRHGLCIGLLYAICVMLLLAMLLRPAYANEVHIMECGKDIGGCRDVNTDKNHMVPVPDKVHDLGEPIQYAVCAREVILDESNVYDGDTLTKVEFTLGFNLIIEKSFRLARIDAPEISRAKGDELRKGIESRDALRKLIANKKVKIQPTAVDKYGRWVAEVYLGNTNVSDYMLQNGFADVYGENKEAHGTGKN